jgi:hypothetical protein
MAIERKNCNDELPKFGVRVLTWDNNDYPQIGKLVTRFGKPAWIDDQALPLRNIKQWAEVA